SGHDPCAAATGGQSALQLLADSQWLVDHMEWSAHSQTAITPAQADT
ncbi:hypothetical protein A2U01_0075147, partial [Trifolium medium]|nr:hypothetical protein [Trifolium medium]